MKSFADVRHDVLDLHKTVLDAARREYERDHGRLRNTEFLSVLIEDPAFAWLNPLTALIVRIDEALEDEEQSPELEELASRLRALIAPGIGISSEGTRTYCSANLTPWSRMSGPCGRCRDSGRCRDNGAAMTKRTVQ